MAAHRVNRTEFLQILSRLAPGLSPKRGSVEQGTCFTGDTVIHTLGGDFTAADLLSRGVTSFRVYSTDGQRLRIGRAFGLRKTRESAEVFLVTFDTGDQITLTADHLVMMRDGTYRKVEDLSAGDSVMPFNYGSYDGYKIVYDRITKGRVRACRWAFAEWNGRSPGKRMHVHHKDGNRTNDDPDNLQELTNSQHGKQHWGVSPPMHRPDVAAKVSAAMMGNKRGLGKPKPGTAKALVGNQHALKNDPHPDPKKQYQREWARKRSQERTRQRQAAPNNHKVLSVVYAGREDVYDLSVRKYHNFAANGVFIHNCFVFENGWGLTFNDEIACRTKTGLPPDFCGAVPADPLTRALENVPAVQDDAIRLELTGGELLIRWSDRKKDVVSVRVESEVVLPIDAVDLPESWALLDDLFARGIEQVQDVAGTNDEEFMCTCVHLHPDFIEATDKRQATRYDVPTGVAAPCLVRQSSLKHVIPLGMTKVGETDSWVHFRNAVLIFSCRRFVEDYPDLSAQYDFPGDRAVLPRGGVEAAKLAAVFVNDADADNNKVTVTLTGDRMVVRGDGPAGYASRELDMTYAGDPLSFRLKPAMLEQLIRKHKECDIGAPGGKRKMRITGDGWVYTVALAATDPAPQEDRARARRPDPEPDADDSAEDVGEYEHAEARDD